MFCPSCGAPNPDGSRFCNQCGHSFPAPSESGAQRASLSGQSAAANTGSQQHSGSYSGVSSNTLHNVGIRSAGGRWAALIGAGLGLLGLGAIGAWLALHGKAASPTPIEVGTPTIGDGDPNIDFVTGGARVLWANRDAGLTRVLPVPSSTNGSGSSSGSRGGPRDRRGSESAAQTGATNTPAGEQAGGSNSGSTSTTNTTNPNAGGNSAGSGSGNTAGEASAGGTANPPGGNTEPTNPPAANPPTETGSTPPAEGGEADDRDIVLELFAARVRRLIRNYYVPRAQTCFDRALRDNSELRGTVVVAFAVDNAGRVTRATTDRNTTGSESLASCLTSQVRSWEMPPAPEAEVEMAVPFSR